MRRLFGHGQQASCSTSAGASPTLNQSRDSLLSRADEMCKNLRKKRSVQQYGRGRKCFQKVKEYQKGLIVIDFQGTGNEVPLNDYHKLYDGSMRYTSHIQESDVRKEIVRLVRQKTVATHDLDLIDTKDFDFVKCVNRIVKVIDGDAPFDASGINQVYKNGAIYVRLNSTLLQSGDNVRHTSLLRVSFCQPHTHDWLA